MIEPNHSTNSENNYMGSQLQEVSNHDEEIRRSFVYADPEPVFGLDEASKQFIDDFFKEDSYFSQPTQDFVKNIFSEGDFKVEQLITDQLLIQDFLLELQASIQDAMVMCSEIKFRSYEQERLTYPSTLEMENLVGLILEIRKKYGKFKKTKAFLEQFDKIFIPFLHHIERQIREQASQARLLQIQALETSKTLPPEDKEFQLAVANHHVVDLNNKPGQHWSELNAILNLSRFDWNERRATAKELKFFHFITLIYDRCFQSDKYSLIGQ